MNLDDFEQQNRRFMNFVGDFKLRDTFQKRIAPKSIGINMEKLRMKVAALNVDFDGLSLDFLRSRKFAHKGTKERYTRKSRYFTIVGQSFVKTVADHHGHATYRNKHWWRALWLYQHRWLWKTLNIQNKGFLLMFAIFGCSAHSKNELRRNGWR